eukprot:5906150-Pyramimonas_sp.AAC.1
MAINIHVAPVDDKSYALACQQSHSWFGRGPKQSLARKSGNDSKCGLHTVRHMGISSTAEQAARYLNQSWTTFGPPSNVAAWR